MAALSSTSPSNPISSNVSGRSNAADRELKGPCRSTTKALSKQAQSILLSDTSTTTPIGFSSRVINLVRPSTPSASESSTTHLDTDTRRITNIISKGSIKEVTEKLRNLNGTFALVIQVLNDINEEIAMDFHSQDTIDQFHRDGEKDCEILQNISTTLKPLLVNKNRELNTKLSKYRDAEPLIQATWAQIEARIIEIHTLLCPGWLLPSVISKHISSIPSIWKVEKPKVEPKKELKENASVPAKSPQLSPTAPSTVSPLLTASSPIASPPPLKPLSISQQIDSIDTCLSTIVFLKEEVSIWDQIIKDDKQLANYIYFKQLEEQNNLKTTITTIKHEKDLRLIEADNQHKLAKVSRELGSAKKAAILQHEINLINTKFAAIENRIKEVEDLLKARQTKFSITVKPPEGVPPESINLPIFKIQADFLQSVVTLKEKIKTEASLYADPEFADHKVYAFHEFNVLLRSEHRRISDIKNELSKKMRRIQNFITHINRRSDSIESNLTKVYELIEARKIWPTASCITSTSTSTSTAAVSSTTTA